MSDPYDSVEVAPLDGERLSDDTLAMLCRAVLGIDPSAPGETMPLPVPLIYDFVRRLLDFLELEEQKRKSEKPKGRPPSPAARAAERAELFIKCGSDERSAGKSARSTGRGVTAKQASDAHRKLRQQGSKNRP